MCGNIVKLNGMGKRVLFWTASVLLVAGLTVYACGKEKDNAAGDVQVGGERSGLVVDPAAVDAIDTLTQDWSGLATRDLVKTPCRSLHPYEKVWFGRDTVRVTVGTDGSLFVSHLHKEVNCGNDSVVAKVSVEQDTIVLLEYEYTRVQAYCSCNTDVYFHVDGIPRGCYAVKVCDKYGDVYYRGSVKIGGR